MLRRAHFTLGLIPCAILLIACPTVAKADKQYPTSIIAVAQSPVTLTNCEVWATDWNEIPNGLIDLGVAFTNNSDKPVTALRVTFVAYDSFNTVIAKSDLDTTENTFADDMSVGPGATFELLGPKSWHGKNEHPSKDHVSCEATAVRFADGTVWAASPDVSAQPQTPSPVFTNNYPSVTASPTAIPIDFTDLFISRINNDYMTCISFKNISNQPIQAVGLSFSYVNAFGSTRHSEVERDGSFSPGVLIQGPTKHYSTSWNLENKKNCWPQGDATSPLLTSVSVSVLNVEYADSSTWSSTDPPTPSMSKPIDVADLGLPKDMQTVALAQGRPCYITESDTAGLGHMEMWYYNCAVEGRPGREVYTFVNGRLFQHMSF